MAGALARRLGTGDAVVIGLGSMIGAGVFSAFAPAAAAAGSGLLNRKPCISVHPSEAMLWSCSAVSTPSAVAVMPMPLASAATARTMVSELESSLMFLTNERSILILSNGKLCR